MANDREPMNTSDSFGLPPDESPARDLVCDLLVTELLVVGATADAAGEATTFDLRDGAAIRGIMRYLTARDSGGRDGVYGERKRVLWERLGRALASRECESRKRPLSEPGATALDAVFTDEHVDAIGKACEKLWNGEPPHDPIHSPRPVDHPLAIVGRDALAALNAAEALKVQYYTVRGQLATERLSRETAEREREELIATVRVFIDSDEIAAMNKNYAALLRAVRPPPEETPTGERPT